MFFIEWLRTLPIPIRIVQWTILHIRIQIHLIILSYWISTQESTKIRRVDSGSEVVVACFSVVFTSGVESGVTIESTCIVREWSESATRVDIGFTVGIIDILLYNLSCTRRYCYNRTKLVRVVVVSIRDLTSTRRIHLFFCFVGKNRVSSDTIQVVLLECDGS